MPEGRPKKIAVLGGGVAALAAVADLTSQPDWQSKFEITVYQMGWRLGGKGASGRNQQMHNRIEEHGPHVWFGFYDNAFHILRNVLPDYLEAAPRTPFQRLLPSDENDHNTLFIPIDHASVIDPDAGIANDWWHLDLPVFDGEPGLMQPPEPLEALANTLEYLAGHAFSLGSHPLAASQSGMHDPIESFSKSLLGEVTALSTGGLVKAIEMAHNHLRRALSQPGLLASAEVRIIGGLLEAYQGSFLQRFLAVIDTLEAEIRHAVILLDIGVAAILGMIRGDVLKQGFEQLNDQDYSRWLEKNGCRCSWSAPVQAVYGAAFAFQHGNTDQPDPDNPDFPRARCLEAGTALRDSLRMYFAHHGSYLYKMRGAMGDTIAAPLYLALKRRGVKFAFFHKVDALHVNAAFSSIESIDMREQTHVKSGEYQPLFDVPWGDGSFLLPSWPNCPFYEQLSEGDQLREQHADLESDAADWEGAKRTLRRGADFDEIILGISVRALRTICAELVREPSGRWKDLVTSLKAIQTQSAQLWFTQSTVELGWMAPDVARETAVAGLSVQPLDTWSDMSRTLMSENWPADAAPASVQYICGPLDDADPPDPDPNRTLAECKNDAVRRNALTWLKQYAYLIWPNTSPPGAPGEFRWDLLLGSNDGEQRLSEQYFRANINDSDRYVLSVDNTCQYRLQAWRSGFGNLFLAGDWTKNGVDAGCVESAATSGRQAARAVCRAEYELLGEQSECIEDYRKWLHP